MEIKIMRDILEANQAKADDVKRVLSENSVTMLNLIGSPGSGKTSLLENVISKLNTEIRIAIIEGDVETDRDARRLQRFDIPITVINTGGACHLESVTILEALKDFDLKHLDLIFVENIGNLVCPAEFNIGENGKIAVSSVTEGDDKPIKYPLLFRESRLAVLNKIDMTHLTDFSKEEFKAHINEINGKLPLIETSCREDKGIEEVCSWIKENLRT